MSEAWTFVCASGELLPGETRTAFDEVTHTSESAFISVVEFT